MESQSHQEREVRAARNQAMFRAVNENLRALNAAFQDLSDTYTVACECADPGCIAMIEIAPVAYEAVRGEPRRFVVLPAHIVRDVEDVVEEHGHYVVVEKLGTAADVAEATAPDPDPV